MSSTNAHCVTLSPVLRESILDASRSVCPREMCGLLISSREADDNLFTQWTPMKNMARDAESFRLDPRTYRDIERASWAKDWQIVGLVHSHPLGIAMPSKRDLACVREIWGESSSWTYLICGLKESAGSEIRAWKLSGGRFREQTVCQTQKIEEISPGYSPND